jgi:hypothetical protein
MKILARSRALPRAVAPPPVRDRGDGGGLVVLLTMALVFVPVVGLHVACLAHPAADGAKPVAAAPADGDGGAGG